MGTLIQKTSDPASAPSQDASTGAQTRSPQVPDTVGELLGVDREPRASLVFKDSSMFVIILGLWVLSLLYFDPKILAYATPREPWLARAGIVAFMLFVNFFWLYGIYHVVTTVFSLVLSKRPRPVPAAGSADPSVAVLYLTMNDFSEAAIRSCLAQDYRDADVYVLDDSTDPDFRARVDRFCELHRDSGIRVIRREGRRGFKAGNLNHALSTLHERYALFCVADADTLLPRQFLKRLTPYFAQDERIGFVQANQHVNPGQREVFARDFSFMTDIHGNYYPPAKSRYGFLMFYGHGGLVRSEAWERAGGFPEVLCEDLAFTSRLRERGYLGVYAPEVICHEDLPSTYPKYLRRQERWVKGTAEYLIKFFPSLMKSRDVAWFEKLDVVLSASVLLNAAPFLAFLLLIGWLLPLCALSFGLRIPLIVTPFSSVSESLQVYRLGLHDYASWSLPFFLMMTLTGCSQFLAIALFAMRRPARMLRCMGEFTFIALATVPIYTIYLVSFLATGKGGFHPTGDGSRSSSASGRGVMRVLPWIDLSFAGLFIWLFFNTANAWLLTIASALALHPWLVKRSGADWQRSGMNPLIYFPFVMIVVVVVLISLSFM